MRRYELSAQDQKRLENNFVYHPPKDDQPARYVALREAWKVIAVTVMEMCPPSQERSVALTHIEEGMMAANAAIARNE